MVTPPILRPSECEHLSRGFDRDAWFERRVVMERHNFGRGRYGYFAEPLPKAVRTLRERLYGHLVKVANHWQELWEEEARYPDAFADYQSLCAERGQARSTPLLLRYEPGGYNLLHQDVYGEERFPLQALIPLTPRSDYDGGEFLLTESRPRQQSRGTALRPEQGQIVIFSSVVRPYRGKTRWLRATVRHGMSDLRGGPRTALGLIFHGAA